MSKGPIKNTATSIHQRLLNVSRITGRSFNDLVLYYAMERFLQRLSKSKYQDRFILKGALMLFVWNAPITRVTRDIDMLGRISNDMEVIRAAMAEICSIKVADDGLIFDPSHVATEPIAEDADYPGVRARFQGHLGNMKIPMQIDVGFSDIITPDAMAITYPAIFEHSGPGLQGYNRETVIAEKFETMVKLGEINTRMKDFFDVWLLSDNFAFDGRLLARAISATFNRRQIGVEHNPPCFSASFENDPGRASQWNAFIRRSRLPKEPEIFPVIMDSIRDFLAPVAHAIVSGQDFHRHWMPAEHTWTSQML